MRADARDSVDAVLVAASEDDGGMARSVYLLARDLTAFGVRPHVVVHRETGLGQWLRDAGIPCETVPELIETGLRGVEPDERGLSALMGNLRRMPTAVARLREICGRVCARVLYSHGTWSNYVAALAGMSGTAPPVVWHIRNDHSAALPRLGGRLLARLGRVRAIIAVSQSAAQPYARLPNPLHVVYNGVDRSVLDAAVAPLALREQVGADGDAVMVGFVGRLEPHKGIAVLMDGFRLAARRLSSLHLVVLGGSARHATVDQVDALRRVAADWDLAPRIHLLGYVDDIERHMAALDVIAVPSICRDGCPRAVIEAMTLGVPVVASRIGGIPEIVRDGGGGILVPPGSAEALADALVALGADRDRRCRMGAAAAEEAQRFDSRTTAEAVATVLRDVASELSEGAGAPAPIRSFR